MRLKRGTGSTPINNIKQHDEYYSTYYIQYLLPYIPTMFVLLHLLRLAGILAVANGAVDSDATSTSTATSTIVVESSVSPTIALRIYTVVVKHNDDHYVPSPHHHSSVIHAQCVIDPPQKMTHHSHQQQYENHKNDIDDDHSGSWRNVIEVCCREILDQISNDSHIDVSGAILALKICQNDIISSTFDFNPYDLHRTTAASTTSITSTASTTSTVFSWVYDIPTTSSSSSSHTNNVTTKNKNKNSFTKTSTFILAPHPYDIHNHQSILQYYDSSVKDNTHTRNDVNEPNTTIKVWLHTILSQSGGMHRTMDHFIHVQPPPPPTPLFDRPSHANVTLYMLLHLPSHVFINIEDCFQYDTPHTNTTLLQSLRIVSPSLPDTLNIDQEEPEFVSPAHIVLIEIQLLVPLLKHGATKDDDDVDVDPWNNVTSTIHFGTTFHIRYPKPFSTTNPSRLNHHMVTTFRHVWMAPPILTSGHATTTTATTTNNIQNEEITEMMVIIVKEQHSMLQLWIAGGHQSHFTITMITTITVAMIGSMIMLYDLSTSTIWI